MKADLGEWVRVPRGEYDAIRAAWKASLVKRLAHKRGEVHAP